MCAQKLKPFGLIDPFTLSFYSSRRLLASRHEISVLALAMQHFYGAQHMPWGPMRTRHPSADEAFGDPA